MDHCNIPLGLSSVSWAMRTEPLPKSISTPLTDLQITGDIPPKEVPTQQAQLRRMNLPIYCSNSLNFYDVKNSLWHVFAGFCVNFT